MRDSSNVGGMENLVTINWLAEHLWDPDLVILDCSVTSIPSETGITNFSGRAEYDKGHIPGAGFADLKGDLCDPDAAVEFAPPTPEAFCAAMGRLGVGDASRVILYDSSFSAWAARVWWMLRWVGFDRAALLDGGLGAWVAEGRALSTEPASHPARTLTPAPRPELIAGREDVLAAIDDPRVHLVDTMPAEYFAGGETMYARPGHIPTAVNVPAMDALDETGHLKAKHALKTLHPTDRGERYITYCGGGILASLCAFTMTQNGYRDVAVYTASLQEWAADPTLPMETGQPATDAS